MLNTAVAYGLGLGAVDVEPDGKKCSPIIRDLLTSFSKLEYIPETQMDFACAVEAMDWRSPITTSDP